MIDIDTFMTNGEAIPLLTMMKRNSSFWQCLAINKAIESLRQPERTKSKWCRRYKEDLGTPSSLDSAFDKFEFVCLSCKSIFGKATKYCPNCGADMRKED